MLKKGLAMMDNLLPLIIIGAEEPEDTPGDPGSSDPGNDQPSSEETNNDSPGSNDDTLNIDGLKSALEKERQNNRKLSKDLRRFQKAEAEAEMAKKTELEQAQAREEAATKRVQSLAQALLTTQLHNRIAHEAASMGFIDTDDAIKGVDISSIEYEQDEEDPTQVDIDVKSIKAALKDLSTKKPHYLRTGTDDGDPTGTPHGGRKKKKRTSEQTYRDRYPSLR